MLAGTEAFVAEEGTETAVPGEAAGVPWAETAATAEKRARIMALSQSMMTVVS